VVKNFFKHPLRTLLTLGSLAVAIFLFCFLRSVVVTLHAGVEAAKSNRLIVQSAVSLFVDLPLSYRAKIQAIEGVELCSPMNWFGAYYQEPSNFFAQFAIDPALILDLYPEIRIEEGNREAFLYDQRACLIGSELARDFGWKVGDQVPLLSALYPRAGGAAWTFNVAGVYRSSSPTVDSRTLFFHFKYLEKSLDEGGAEGPKGAGIYVLRIAKDAEPTAVMAGIDALFENGPQRVQATTEAVFQAQFVSMVGNIPFFVSAIGGGVFFAVILAVLNTLLIGAREQTRDVGILKALGFSSGGIFAFFMLQSLALCLAGGGVGLLLSASCSDAIARAIAAFFPGYYVRPETFALGALASVVIGLLAGLAPAIRSSRISPAASLRRGI
jgi:putative ABC transport system permease protein